jgi:hypothetical protein
MHSELSNVAFIKEIVLKNTFKYLKKKKLIHFAFNTKCWQP